MTPSGDGARGKGRHVVSTEVDGAGIDKVLRDAVDSGAVPHVAAIAADRDGVIYAGAAGPRAAGESAPVTTDTLFRLMSMTKMPATVVALQEMEKGNLELDAPVVNYGHRHPQRGGRAEGRAAGADGRRPGYRLQLRHQHRVAGPGRGGGDRSGPGRRRQAGRHRPARHEPHDVPDDRRRTPELHARARQGRARELGLDRRDPQPGAGVLGGHGLCGPPSDYIRFTRALLRGGELDGARILRPETVDDAFRNQIGELDFPAEIPTCDPASTDTLALGPGYKWGYGLLLNTQDIPGMRRASSGAWAGLCNTHFWVDRTTGVCASIYSNSLPFVTLEALALYQDFERALYAAL